MDIYYKDGKELLIGDEVEVTSRWDKDQKHTTILELGLEEVTGDNYNYVPCVIILGSDDWIYEEIDGLTVVMNIRLLKRK